MASPPFDINALLPADDDFVSQHPSNARLFRDIVESWLLINHNNLGQHAKVELASTATPTGAAGIGVLWQESGVLKYRTAGDAIDFTMDAGKLTMFPTGAVGLTLESTAATDIAAEFKGSGGSVFAGQGADETFAVKGDSNLDTSPWFSVSAAAAAFAGTLAVTGALTAASLALGTALPVAQGGTGATTVAAARTALGLGTADTPTFAGAVMDGGFLTLPATLLTIAAGAITATQSRHAIETEGGAGTDNLDTINGGSSGAVLIIRPEHPAHTVVVRHLVGNIALGNNGQDFTMDDDGDILGLIFIGSNWVEMFRNQKYT